MEPEHWSNVAGAAGGVLGAIGMIGARKKQFKDNKRLMEIQMQNQMKLNQQGADLQLQMWKDTSYPAQMEMMKAAGLNPGLMYGMGGGGGTTTGSQGGGSASGSSVQPMDIGNAIMGAKAAAEIALLAAQKEKNWVYIRSKVYNISR